MIEQEMLEVLKAIRGEIVKLRNDFLMLRVAVEQIENKIKEPKSQPQEKIVAIDKLFGENTKIEKL